MKKLMDQGLAVSRDFSVKAGGKAQDLGEKGYAASKKLAARAGAKAQELGERGVLTLEIKQLEGQAQKLISRLGNEAYKAFVERKVKTLSADMATIKTILTELDQIRQSIEEKEAELKKKGKA
jgi:predicted Fe-Mo cluster-binding NifX family protein